MTAPLSPVCEAHSVAQPAAPSFELPSGSYYRWFLFLVLGVLLSACGDIEPNSTESTSPVPGGNPSAAPPPSLLLITVDTLRADVLGFSANLLAGGDAPESAGPGTASTPNLDRLAATGRVFPFAHAHNVMTLPSHANILTGLYPYQHGVRDNGGFVLGEDIPTLASLTKEAGFATAAFVAAYPLDARYGLARGFAVYDDVEIDPSILEGGLPDPRKPFGERRGDEVVERALEWWQSHADQPRFLWLHLFDPHGPYQPGEPWASQHPDSPYLGEVAAVDAYLGPLLGPLVDAGSSRTLVIFTSDHGEALGDHGEATHGLFAYEATLRVPLVIHGPGVEPGIDERAARHVDILPTALEALGIEQPADLPGSSLLGAPSAESTTYFEALSGHLNHGWAPLRGTIHSRQKMIDLPLPELYDLAADPGERNNRLERDRRGFRELQGLLPEESVWPPEVGDLDPEEAARLRSLGYLSSRGSAAKNSFGPEDDPKRLIDLDSKLKELLLAYHQGNYGQTARLANEILSRRPTPLAFTYLALANLKQGDPRGALATMEAAVELDSASLDLQRQMGLTLLQLGRTERAAEVLAKVVEDGRASTFVDATASNNLALAHVALGRASEARSVLDDLLGREDDNAGTWENLAYVALEQGDAPAAERAARRAIELEPSAGAHNNLALALYEQSRADEAIQAWRRALELDPRNPDPLFNVGLVAAEIGQKDLAREALRTFVGAFPEGHPDPRAAEARRLLATLTP